MCVEGGGMGEGEGKTERGEVESGKGKEGRRSHIHVPALKELLNIIFCALI